MDKEILKLMNNINYGYIDKQKKIHEEIDEFFSDNYILQSPKELEKNKYGVCWDQVELERHYFEKYNFNIKTYFIVYYDNDKCPTHTFLVYEKNNKYYWFEHSWNRFRGIYEYGNLDKLLLDVKNKYIKYELENNYNKDNLIIYEYTKPEYNIGVLEFYKHCEKGKKI